MSVLCKTLFDTVGRALCPLVIFGLILCSGCARERTPEDVLLQVGDRTITLSEYDQSVRLAREEAFPGERQIDPEMLADLHLRVFNQLSEELVLAAYAADRDIAVSPSELEAAVDAIKADYPDDTFEETLLENAVSFPLWKRRLEARLLAEKVIREALVNEVRITPEDVAEYHATYYPQGVPETEDRDALHQRIVTHLRRNKGEAGYEAWIADLEKSYPVVINQAVWESYMQGTQ